LTLLSISQLITKVVSARAEIKDVSAYIHVLQHIFNFNPNTFESQPTNQVPNYLPMSSDI